MRRPCKDASMPAVELEASFESLLGEGACCAGLRENRPKTMFLGSMVSDWLSGYVCAQKKWSGTEFKEGICTAQEESNAHAINTFFGNRQCDRHALGTRHSAIHHACFPINGILNIEGAKENVRAEQVGRDTMGGEAVSRVMVRSK